MKSTKANIFIYEIFTMY